MDKADKIRKLRALAASEREIGNPEAARTAEKVANELEKELGRTVRDKPRSEATHNPDDFYRAAQGFRSAAGFGGFGSRNSSWNDIFYQAFGSGGRPYDTPKSTAETYRQAERERKAHEAYTDAEDYKNEQWAKKARAEWEKKNVQWNEQDEAERKAQRERQKDRRESEKSAEQAYADSYGRPDQTESVFKREWFEPGKEDRAARAKQKAESDEETRRRRKEEFKRTRAKAGRKEKERHRRKVGLRRGNVVRHSSIGGVVVRTWWNEETDEQHCYVALDNGAKKPWIAEILRTELEKISD